MLAPICALCKKNVHRKYIDFYFGEPPHQTRAALCRRCVELAVDEWNKENPGKKATDDDFKALICKLASKCDQALDN